MEKKNINGHGKAGFTDDENEERSKSNRDRASERAYEPAHEKTKRQPSGERENAFNALAWLLEGATGLIEELRHNDLGLPEDFWVHAYAARKESLLALRAILDDMIEQSESQVKKEEEKQKRRDRRGGINVDF
ncbi:MAG: hypothetical protein U0350_29145 [Caldilineaceae bacterium]